MLETLLRTAQKYNLFNPSDTVVVGCSGGADSVALLRGLLLLKDDLRLTAVCAAHINHNLREGAAADEAYVAEICAAWGVPFQVYPADVHGLAEAEGLSLEDAGRRLRYGFLETAAGKFSATKIAVAHNRDDQAETVLMNLLRGAGLKGLCGIPPVRTLSAGIDIVRPLIDTPRGVIEVFLAEQSIPFCTDPSNGDPSFTRNRIRNEIMPLIKQYINPNVSETLARNAALLTDDEAYLSAQARAAFETVVASASPLSLDVDKTTALPPAMARRVIREAFRRVSGSVTDMDAACVERTLPLFTGRTGRTAELPHGLRARRVYDRLEIAFVSEYTASEPFCHTLTAEGVVRLPSGKRVRLSHTVPSGDNCACTREFCYDRIKTFLCLRTRRPGDFIYLEGVGRRKLQDYFTDRKLPREARDTTPLLADGNEIVWIMDDRSRISGRYKPQPGHASVWVIVEE